MWLNFKLNEKYTRAASVFIVNFQYVLHVAFIIAIEFVNAGWESLEATCIRDNLFLS